jgi:hypothetical protein
MRCRRCLLRDDTYRRGDVIRSRRTTKRRQRQKRGRTRNTSCNRLNDYEYHRIKLRLMYGAWCLVLGARNLHAALKAYQRKNKPANFRPAASLLGAAGALAKPTISAVLRVGPPSPSRSTGFNDVTDALGCYIQKYKSECSQGARGATDTGSNRGGRASEHV